jgi:hypothetical protein
MTERPHTTCDGDWDEEPGGEFAAWLGVLLLAGAALGALLWLARGAL